MSHIPKINKPIPYKPQGYLSTTIKTRQIKHLKPNEISGKTATVPTLMFLKIAEYFMT